LRKTLIQKLIGKALLGKLTELSIKRLETRRTLSTLISFQQLFNWQF